jgi:hypothetical protein
MQPQYEETIRLQKLSLLCALVPSVQQKSWAYIILIPNSETVQVS